MGVIVSVNVGLPQDVAWQGKTVRTAVWKFLDRCDMTHKKRPHTRANRNAPM